MTLQWARRSENSKEKMIWEDLRGRGIKDEAVLRSMREVPREAFIPPALAMHAYEDHPLPIAEEQTISQPYIVAYMTAALELTPSDRVLEIGTGSGYAAAVLSRIVKTVDSVERLEALAKSAQERLQKLGYNNIIVHEGDGTLGWRENAPYDAIVVAAGAPQLPPLLLDQLALGGRLVIPIGPTPSLQMLIRIRRVGEDDYRSEELCPVRFVPLIGAAGW